MLFNPPCAIDRHRRVYSMSKRAICSAVQILHNNESLSLLYSQDMELVLTKHSSNNFTVKCAREISTCTGSFTPLSQTSICQNDPIRVQTSFEFERCVRHVIPRLR